MQTGALLLDGGTLNYFGKPIPINLIVAVIAAIVLVGGAEYYRITNGLVYDISNFGSLVLLVQLPTHNSLKTASCTRGTIGESTLHRFFQKE